MNADKAEPEQLSYSTKLAYGAGDLGPAITTNVLSFFLLFFFTNVAGLNAGLAGGVLMVGKIWDAVNDPIVGVLSDRTRSRWGRRHSWMLFGSIPFGVFFFLQWLVPHFSRDPAMNQWGLFWYYVIIAILFNTAYTAVNLPYTALTPELTQDYNERTSLNSFRFAFSIGGSILSLVIAQVVFTLIQSNTTTTSTNCDTGSLKYAILAGICAVLSVLPLYWCIWGTRSRALAAERRHFESETTTTIPFLEQLRIVFSNRPFLYVIGIYFCSWLAVQVTAAVIPYFVTGWMGLSEGQFIQVTLAVQGTALAMLFFWNAMSQRVGKKAVYYMGMVLWVIAQFGLFFLRPGQIGLMYFLAVLAGFGVATAYLIPWSMMPDVIELDELQTGQRREGIFYAFMVMLQKLGLALGLFLLGIGLSWAGFIEQVPCQPPPQQPNTALLAIRIAIGPLPTAALVLGLVLAYFYPITREVHSEILLKLKQRREAQHLPEGESQ